MDSPIRETTPAEQILSRSLRQVLAPLVVGDPVAESDLFRSALGGLEYFLPEVLREIHAAWKWEALDGVDPLLTRKSGEREFELWGVATVISDQTVVPLHLRLRIDARRDQVDWLECEIVADQPESLRQVPYSARRSLLNHLSNVLHMPEQIAWVYRVTYGQPTPH